jgi:hypothetical protein
MSDYPCRWSPESEWRDCAECGGRGTIMTCPDDVCRATGECRHGDPGRMCPACGGEGYVSIGEDEEEASDD